MISNKGVTNSFISNNSYTAINYATQNNFTGVLIDVEYLNGKFFLKNSKIVTIDMILNNFDNKYLLLNIINLSSLSNNLLVEAHKQLTTSIKYNNISNNSIYVMGNNIDKLNLFSSFQLIYDSNIDENNFEPSQNIIYNLNNNNESILQKYPNISFVLSPVDNYHQINKYKKYKNILFIPTNLDNPEEIINISGVKTYNTKWSTKIDRLPKFLYDFIVDPENKFPITDKNSFIAWCKTMGYFITGHKFIGFDGNTVENNLDKYLSLDNNLCIGCWWSGCDDNKYLYPNGSVQKFIDGYIDNGYKPHKYIQCYYYGLIMYSFCQLKGLDAKIIAGHNVIIDNNHNYVLDGTDSSWFWHIWNEIAFEGEFHAFDCCPGNAMNPDTPFIKGPVSFNSDINSSDLKYFNTYGLLSNSHIYTLQNNVFDDLTEKYNSLQQKIIENGNQNGGAIIVSKLEKYQYAKYFTVLNLQRILYNVLQYKDIIDIRPTINYILEILNSL